MKRIILAVFIALSPLSLTARESIDELSKNTDALYRQGAAAIDGAYTALGISMLGWGLGLAAGAGLLVALLHNSKASTSHAHCH